MILISDTALQMILISDNALQNLSYTVAAMVLLIAFKTEFYVRLRERKVNFIYPIRLFTSIAILCSRGKWMFTRAQHILMTYLIKKVHGSQ